MTCAFGYVFLLLSAHKRRKFFLQTLVSLVQPEGLQQVVQAAYSGNENVKILTQN